MELTSEDVLCLNVLLANRVHAVRIDESAMVVYGLCAGGQVKVQLHPNCRADVYLRGVRELLSSHVLGHPGGYPVFLRRWTRMGQAKDEALERLLMLGEPEALAAVVCAPGLTDELARHAWWAMPTAENARRMLARDAVAASEVGRVLAEYLVEHLAFEDDPSIMMETVRLVLQPGLIDEQARHRLWSGGKHKAAYHIGFLERLPDALPEPLPQRADADAQMPHLQPLIARNNAYAACLARVLSAPGQTYLSAAEGVLRRPANHDVVIALLNAVAAYFMTIRPRGMAPCDIGGILLAAEAACSGDAERPEGLTELLATAPHLEPEARAIIALSQVGEPVVAGILSRTTAVGALMRRKLEPALAPIVQQFGVLRGRPG